MTAHHQPGESGPAPSTASGPGPSPASGFAPRAAMLTGRRPVVVAATLAAAVLAAGAVVAACATGKPPSAAGTAVQKLLPQRIIPAPRSLLAASSPQPDGAVWVVAGSSSFGLFKLNSASGAEDTSMSVSHAARSVAENSAGVVAIGLGTRTSGALELIRSGGAGKTVSLPAPAVQVVSASTGTSFYVLTAWPKSASVSVVSASGRLLTAVPAPAGSVSIAADPQQGQIYALQHDGIVDEIGLASGKIQSTFTVDGDGMSIAMSPNGSRLFVLKGTPSVSNIAVIDTATESVLKVLPAPSHCVQLAVSPDGAHLYEAVGSPGYGNIQVFGL